MNQSVKKFGGGFGISVFLVVLTSCRVTSFNNPVAIQPSESGPNRTTSGSVNNDGDLLALKSMTINKASAYVIAKTLAAGSRSAPVESITGFSVGDEVLVIQMQVPSLTTPLPREFITIASITSGSSPSLNFSTPLLNTYLSGRRGSDNQSQAAVTQVVRVPHYKSVTVSAGNILTAPGWDKDAGKGGILVFKSSGPVTLIGSASIAMDDTGFTGGSGQYVDQSTNYAYQGESFLGRGVQSSSTVAGAGGKGTYVGGAAGYGSNGSGSGGGSSTSSGMGQSGIAFGSADLSSLYLGSGGGGVHTGMGGSSGGGIVMIYAPSLEMDADSVISANGRGGPCLSNASGGSGAGGSIYLVIDDPSINGTLYAIGGSGGCTGWGASSNGGDGRIRVDYSKSSHFNENIASHPAVGQYFAY